MVFRLVKFQLKSRYKILIPMIVIFLLINLLITVKGVLSTGDNSIVIGLIILLGFAAFAIVIFSSTAGFRKDVYEENAYLIFTTPQSSYSILGARLTTAVIELLPFLIIGMLFLGISYVLTYPIGNGSLSNIHTRKEFINLLSTTYLLKVIFLIVMVILLSIKTLIDILTTIYFSIIISKVLIRGKKFARSLAFLVFLLVTFLANELQLLGRIIPSNLILDLTPFSSSYGNFTISVTNESIPIGGEIFSLVFCVALFFITAYLIDKKIDI